MALINESLQILATLGSTLVVYIFIRVGARKDIKELEKRMERVEGKLDTINMRLTRILHV